MGIRGPAGPCSAVLADALDMVRVYSGNQAPLGERDMTHQLLAWLSGDNTLLSGLGLQWASGLLALGIIGILLNDKARKPSAFAPVALRRQQLERDHLFDHAPDMICVAGFDGYLKQVNQAFTQMLGWSREDLLSKPYLEWVHPDDRETSIAANERLLQGESLISFEVRWLQWSAVTAQR